MASSPHGAASGSVLSFVVAGQDFSVPATDVIEVRRQPVLTRVPNSAGSLAGLMNFHGAAIAVVRMSTLLRLPQAEASAKRDARVIVCQQTPPVGLLVDRVLGMGEGMQASAPLDVPALLASQFGAVSVERVRVSTTIAPEREIKPAVTAQALLSFWVAGQRYGLPLQAVAEVAVMPENLAILPRSDTSTLGMLDYRGGVLPLVSIAALLGLDSEADGRCHVLVVSHEGSEIGLVAGAIDGVVRVPESAIEPVPAILRRGVGDAEIDAIARLGGDRSLISILSPARLFRNRDVEQAADQSQARTSNMPDLSTQAADLQFVVFQLGDEVFGLPIAAVDEIVRLPERLTRVPGAPAFVAGVMNLRGKALPLIDQRKRFSSGDGALRGRVIVVTVGQLQAGFIVDGVSEILRVPAASVTSAPALPGEGAKVFDRVAASGNSMVLVVDPKELLDRAERDLLAEFNAKEGSAQAS